MPADGDVKEPIARPALALWLWRRNYNWREAGELFGVSHETVRCWCLPFDHPDRRIPEKDSMEVVVELTGGEVAAGSFYPPHRIGAPAAADRVPEDVQ
jgi:hypothetical protein